MINKKLDNISKQDLQNLITNEVAEGKAIEYKQELPDNKDKSKKEFLADVSSFANASGGNLIFGIIEDSDTGKPIELKGIKANNLDELKQRLDNLIRSGIEPRLPLFDIKEIQLSDSNYVIIIRVQKSWLSPHRVIFSGHDKFYSRSTNGKYPLDVSELKNAFLLSEGINKRIRKFREDRISKIIANETPVALPDNPRILLHIIPFSAFSSTQLFVNIDKIAYNELSPICSGGHSHRYNLEGLLTYEKTKNHQIESYAQLYKNGIIETVTADFIRKGENYMPRSFENIIIKSMDDYIKLSEKHNVELPYVVFLTLLGVKGCRISDEKHIMSFLHNKNSIDRDILLLPEIIINSFEEQISQAMKPIFDSLWNASGFPRSLSYTRDGIWID